MHCPFCDFGPLPDGLRFCPSCGGFMPARQRSEGGGKGEPRMHHVDRFVVTIGGILAIGFFTLAYLQAGGNAPVWLELAQRGEFEAAVREFDGTLREPLAGSGVVLPPPEVKLAVASERALDFGTVTVWDLRACPDGEKSWTRAELESFAKKEIAPRAAQAPSDIFVLSIFSSAPPTGDEPDERFLAKFLYVDQTIHPDEPVPPSFTQTAMPHLFVRMRR